MKAIKICDDIINDNRLVTKEDLTAALNCLSSKRDFNKNVKIFVDSGVWKKEDLEKYVGN